MLIYTILVIVLIIVLIKVNSPQYKGKYGENIVRERLRNIDSYGYIINNIMLNDNGKSRQIDHIAICEYGVFVIETKNYAGTIYGKETSTQWKQYLNRKCFNFNNPIHQNYGHVEIVRKTLEDVTDKIYPLVIFTRRCDLRVEVKSAVIYDDQLENYIKCKDKVLSKEKVDEINKILKDNKITDEEAIKNHDYNVQRYTQYKESIANGGICPRCNRKLIKRYFNTSWRNKLRRDNKRVKRRIRNRIF